MRIKITKAVHKIVFITPFLLFTSSDQFNDFPNHDVHSLELGWFKWGLVFHLIVEKRM